MSLTSKSGGKIYFSNVMGSSKTTLIGTPLFSQLSTSATASAVGAYSLRAVNGTTARVVQVKQIQIVDSSSSPLVPTLTNATSNVLGPFSPNGSIFFNVGSSVFPTTSKMQFDLFTSGNVFMECFVYISSAPKINYPAIFLRSAQVSFYFDNSSTVRLAVYNASGGNVFAPLTIGSIALNTWTHVSVSINQTTSTVYASVNGTVVSSGYSLGGSNYNSSNPLYLVSSNYPSAINISNFRCVKGSSTLPYISSGFTIPTTTLTAFGTGTTLELLDGTAYIQDFWADRLGNLLTAPVTGQTITNWLGGATGYVTTWYDQSGAGNHATQGTAANQPIIQRATKGPGYSVLFNGTTQILSLPTSSYSLLNGLTGYNVSVAERRNTNTPGTFFGVGNTSGNLAGLILGYTSDTQIYFSQRGVNVAPSITGYAGASEPMHYWYFDHSSKASLNEVIYQNGFTTVGSGTDTGTLAAPSGNPVTIGKSLATTSFTTYYSGEIFEILIFTQSLYDLDNTGGLITQIYQNQLSYTGT